MVWLVILAISAIVLGLLVEPFFRAQKAPDSLDEEDYLAAQVADIARDRTAGLITDEEAAAADLEARRRLLAAHRSAEKKPPAKIGAAAGQASAMLVAAAPMAAIALYVALGNPGREPTEEAMRMAAQVQPSAANARSLAESVAALEQRLTQNPDELDDWVMLAESYANLDRFDEAAGAFGKARALAPDRAYLHAAEGESIAMAAGGIVTGDARAALDQALAIDANEPRARFYLAIGAYQEGRREEALDALIALGRDAPGDAGWLPIVRSQIDMISAELGRPVEGASASSADAIEAEIAAGDAPYESWIALIGAYAAVGDMEKAQGAVARAKERYAGAPFVLQEIAAAEARLAEGAPARRGPTTEQMEAAASMSDEDRAAMIEGMVGGLAARLEKEPDDLGGWTMLARSYTVLNEPQKSADAYARAIALAPDDISLHLGRAQALLAVLETKGETIDAATEATVKEIARLDPAHPFALYFQGLAASQRGEKDAARRFWTQLKDSMPEGAPETQRVQEMIDAL
jgi:cytochrome c-type biogenesis protein CcmH